MRRIRSAVVGVLLLAGSIGMADAGIANAATSVVEKSASLHGAVMTTITGYLQAYGSDLSPGDRTRVTALMDRAELSLTRLDSAVRAIPSARTVKAHRAAVAAALARQAEARSAASSGMSEVTPLLTSRMSLVELLRAKRDADRLMGQLDDLALAIRSS